MRRIGGLGMCVVITSRNVGREVTRLAKEETEWCVGGNTEWTADVWLYGNCDLYVFYWYVCRLFVMNYGAVSTNQDDPFCFQRIL